MEKIYTIPVNEAFDASAADKSCGCPFCTLYNGLEKKETDAILGAAMMEPDVRIETNRAGFCSVHFSQMLKQKNRLSLALMLQTHLDETRGHLFSRKKLFEPKNSRKKRLSEINESCFVCEKVDWGMERLMRTFFEMFGDAQFRKLFSEQEFICLPHFDLLQSIAPNYLKKQELDSFNEMCGQLTEKYMNTLYDDVSKFCSMYDYRSSGKDADWGNSRDSIERAVGFLTSRMP